MFEKYKKELLAFYDHQKDTQQFFGGFENLQRSNLRKACLHVFSKRNTNKDQEIIKAFFDPKGQFSDSVTSIERVDLDRFRPLVSFLQREKNIRDEAAVKLLAWLIDFNSFQDWIIGKGKQELPKPGDDKQEADKSGDRSDDEPETGLPDDVHIPEKLSFLHRFIDAIIGRPFSNQKTAISCITFILLGAGIYFLIQNITNETIRQPMPEEKCMYWTGNHYEPVKCNEKIKNATIVPLNLQILNNLKKINLTDTLTSYSLGKVWYSKIEGKREFFTDSGMHPVDTSKRLKPLSKYILSNYVSYYRYLLTHLMLTVGMITTVVLFVSTIYFLRKKQMKC